MIWLWVPYIFLLREMIVSSFLNHFHAKVNLIKELERQNRNRMKKIEKKKVKQCDESWIFWILMRTVAFWIGNFSVCSPFWYRSQSCICMYLMWLLVLLLLLLLSLLLRLLLLNFGFYLIFRKKNPNMLQTEGNQWRIVRYEKEGVSERWRETERLNVDNMTVFIEKKEEKKNTRKTKGQTYQIRTRPNQTKQIKYYLK